MFTLAGWHESKDSAVLAAITALADQIYTVAGNDILVPTLSNLMGVYAGGATMSQAQLSCPSLRELALLDISPFNVGANPVPTMFPATFHDYFDRPIGLVESEAINALIAETAVGAEDEVVLAWFGDSVTAVPAGKLMTVRATSAVATVAYTWTNMALTFSQTLPAGEYAIVGARAENTTLVAFRLVLSGQWWRPGGIGLLTGGQGEVLRFRTGGAGVWGTFDNHTPPTVDCLSTGVDSALIIHLDLIQTHAGR